MELKRGIVLGLSVWASFLVHAATWTGADGVRLEYYEVSGDGATITGCALSGSFRGRLEIPAELGSCPVRSIGDSAFWGCRGLTSVAISSGVTNIGDSAFSGCSSLTSVAIPDSVTSIGSRAFSGCSGLTSFVVARDNPEYSSFNGLLLSKDGRTLVCGVNGCVRIPDGVTSIGASAFYGCSGLASVTIPSSVTSIGDWAFSGCSGLMSFVVAENNPSYASVNGLLLSKDGRALVCGVNGNVTIPIGVTSVGDSAFSGCSGLTSVVIPDGVTRIGDSAFEDCSGLTSVAIPGSVANIGITPFQAVVA